MVSKEMKKIKTVQPKVVDRKRRSFIKKAAYNAPLLIALGSLAKPDNGIAYDLRSDLPPPTP